jgi:hypothetical protein
VPGKMRDLQKSLLNGNKENINPQSKNKKICNHNTPKLNWISIQKYISKSLGKIEPTRYYKNSLEWESVLNLITCKFYKIYALELDLKDVEFQVVFYYTIPKIN